ncbi:MAG TPA: hypothetical protein VL307_06000 [Chitinophagaceae bacterium]|nr:hypothetical protein [Chitinophagaceae bacterium]
MFKKHFICIVALALGVAANTNAQDSVVIKTLPPVTVTATTVRIPPRTWKSFASYFPGAYNSRFYKLNRDWLAKFVLDSQQNRALFTGKGQLLYHISYGYEKNLPEELRQQVKSVYYDYDITRAIKVTEGQRVVWVINVENSKELILLRLEDGEMESVEKLTKDSGGS